MNVLWLILSLITFEQVLGYESLLRRQERAFARNAVRQYDNQYYDGDDGDVTIKIINRQNNNLNGPGQQQEITVSKGQQTAAKPTKPQAKKVSATEKACGKIVDKNNNGEIDVSEKKAFIACLKGAKGAYDGPDADSTVSAQELRCGVQSDTNMNGRIDPDEVAAFEKCLGIKRKESKTISPQEMACGKIVDKNSNGKVDAAEKKAYIACLKGAKGDYDGDKDKKVSPEEMRCGVQADVNMNGVIDADEIAAFQQCLGIKSKEEGFKGYDQDKSGKVSAAEQQCGTQFDANKNGVIDANEMPKFLACLKGAAGGYDGPDPDKKVSLSELKCGMAVDKNHNGQIDKDEVQAFEACLGIDQKTKTGKGYDWDGDKAVSKEEQACGMIVDKNSNGQIDDAEKKAFIACLKGAKGDYDQNKDGVLTTKELKCALQADVNKNGKIEGEEIAAFEVCLGLKKSKKGYDQNGDGVVSPEELICGKLIDENKNGKIDKEETKAFVACLTGLRGGYDSNDPDKKVSPEELACGLAADVNQNGKIDKGEIALFEKCLEDAKYSQILMDFNGDGQMDEMEQICAQQCDCNHDGKLDENEKLKAQKAWLLAESRMQEGGSGAKAYRDYDDYADYADDDYYDDEDDEDYYDDDEYYDDEEYYDDNDDEEDSYDNYVTGNMLKQMLRLKLQKKYQRFN